MSHLTFFVEKLHPGRSQCYQKEKGFAPGVPGFINYNVPFTCITFICLLCSLTALVLYLNWIQNKLVRKAVSLKLNLLFIISAGEKRAKEGANYYMNSTNSETKNILKELYRDYKPAVSTWELA